MTTQPVSQPESENGSAAASNQAAEVLRRQAAGLVRDLRELASTDIRFLEQF